MAELPRDAVLAALDLAVLQDRAADAGAERDHDEVVLAAAGAEAPLGPGGGVGVVVDEDGDREAAGDAVTQGLVAPGQVGCEEHTVAVGVDPAGRADADRVHVVPVGQVQDQFADGVLDHLGALGLVRGLRAEHLQDVAVGVDDARHHLGAADVDADRGHSGGGEVRATLPRADRAERCRAAGADGGAEVAVGAHRARFCRTLTLCAAWGRNGQVPEDVGVRVRGPGAGPRQTRAHRSPCPDIATNPGVHGHLRGVRATGTRRSSGSAGRCDRRTRPRGRCRRRSCAAW
ncbi:hypothetical protein SALBM311S_09447 [Streptomyces alboniger]